MMTQTDSPRAQLDPAGSFFQRYELPTFALAIVLYAVWAAVIVWHDKIPGWLLFLVGGYLTQLHFSLQHESIHAMRQVPKWLRWAVVWPPLGLWFPYPMYNRSHSTHHVNYNLTHPLRDTESNYHLQQRWPVYRELTRALYRANQTLIVRVLVGPFIRLWRMIKRETLRLLSGDFGNLGHWFVHAIGVTLILLFVTRQGMSIGQYLLCFAYPGMMLGMLRTFTEHRFGDRPQQRVAIVESNHVMGLLYLYNNLHAVHHRYPTLPWYRIHRRYREQREDVLAHNDNFYYRGYGEIARRYLFKPVFSPVHPVW